MFDYFWHVEVCPMYEVGFVHAINTSWLNSAYFVVYPNTPRGLSVTADHNANTMPLHWSKIHTYDIRQRTGFDCCTNSCNHNRHQMQNYQTNPYDSGYKTKTKQKYSHTIRRVCAVCVGGSTKLEHTMPHNTRNVATEEWRKETDNRKIVHRMSDFYARQQLPACLWQLYAMFEQFFFISFS